MANDVDDKPVLSQTTVDESGDLRKKLVAAVDQLIVTGNEIIGDLNAAARRFYQIFNSLNSLNDALKVSEPTKVPEPALGLELHNFKVDSNGWIKKTSPNGVEYLENPEGDIWEYLKCERVPDNLVGQQLLTRDAAVRETEKAGKRMPTSEEWNQLLGTKADMPNPVFAGYRHTNGSFYDLNSVGCFWSLLLGSGSSAWCRSLYFGNAAILCAVTNRAYGLSVRCFKG